MKKLTLLAVLIIVFVRFGTAQLSVFHENFELPSGGDSVTTVGTPAWAINTTYFASGSRSIKGTAPAQGDSVSIVTSSFTTIGATEVKLYFSHICKIDYFESGELQVSVDGGTTWIKLDSSYYKGSSGYKEYLFKFNVLSYFIDWDGYNNQTPPTNSWWKNETFDISSLASNKASVKIKFILKKAYTSTNSAYGWLIDDINVIANVGSIGIYSTPFIHTGSPASLMVNRYVGTSPYSYSWSSNPNSSIASIQYPTVYPTVTTTYTCTVTDAQPSSLSASTTVNVLPITTLSFSDSICSGKTAKITISPYKISVCQYELCRTYQGFTTSQPFIGDSIIVNQLGTYFLKVYYNNQLTYTSASRTLYYNTPLATISPITISTNSSPISLVNYGKPSGGTFNGIGISNNIFNPMGFSAGNVPIQYVYTSPYACTEIINSSITVTGSLLDTGAVKDSNTCNMMSSKWTTIAHINYISSDTIFQTGFVINGVAYVVGGMNRLTNVYTNVFKAFNTSTNQWQSKANLPGIGRSKIVAIGVGNYGYCGMGKTADTTVSGGWSKDWFKYNPSTNTWTTLASCPVVLRNPVVFKLGDTIYVGTGLDSNYNASKLFYKYNTLTNTWSTAPTYPGVGREWATAIVVGSDALVGSGMSTNLLKDFYKFNGTVWTQIANFPDSVSINMAAFRYGNNAIVGMNNRNRFYSYSPSTGWVSGINLNGNYQIFENFVNLNDTDIYVFGGGYNQNTGMWKVRISGRAVATSTYTSLYTSMHTNLDVTMTGGLAPFTYSWSILPSGVSFSTVKNPKVFPSTTTTYYVHVKDANGLIATSCVTIVVKPFPTLTISSTSICANQTANLSLNNFLSGLNHVLYRTYQGVTTNQTLSSQNISINQAGSYYVKIDTFSTNTNSVNLTVNPLPTISFTPPASICSSTNLYLPTYASPNGGTFTYGNNLIGNNYATGNLTITYYYTNSYGCQATKSSTIYIDHPIVSVNPNFISLYDTSSIIDLNSYGSPSGGNFSGQNVTNNQFDPSNLPESNYPITYSYTNGNGCTNTAEMTIYVHPIPQWPVSFQSTANSNNSISDITTKNGNIYAIGTMQDITDFYGLNNLQTNEGTTSTSGIFIVKLSRYGTVLWSKSIYADYFYSDYQNIILDEEENIYIAGIFEGTIICDNSIYGNISSGSYYGSFNNMGQLMFLGASEGIYTTDIKSKNESVLLAGRYTSNADFFGRGSNLLQDPDGTYVSSMHNYDYDYHWLVETNSDNGNNLSCPSIDVLSREDYVIFNSGSTLGVLELSNGSLLSSISNSNYSTQTYSSISFNRDDELFYCTNNYFLSCYEWNGGYLANPIWEQPLNLIGSSVKSKSNGCYLNDQESIYDYDNQGNINWLFSLNAQTNGLDKTYRYSFDYNESDSNIYLGGSFYDDITLNQSFILYDNNGFSNSFIDRLDNTGNFTRNQKPVVIENLSNFQIVPNPNDGNFKLTFSNNQFIKITISNINGELISELNSQSNKILNFDYLNNGIYILKIDYGNKTEIKKVVICR